MTEDFVSFSLAMKLKEKGFREEVNAYYGKWEKLFDVHPALDMNDCDYRASAPTISQVLKWLREEKKILVVAAPAFLYRDARYFWQCGIYEISLLPNVIPFHKFIDNQVSYDSAILTGIDYVIDNLI